MTTPRPEIDRVMLGESFDRHRASPEVTIDAYVRACRIDLGESVMKRERVYLDKCFWITLRDVAIGRSKDKHCAALLASLRAGVQGRRQICPISETVFIELLKQEDLRTRRATAELIDELSEGVTLAPHPERVATEVAHFLYSKTEHSVYSMSALVWSKLGYVLGVAHPVSKAFDENEQRVVQKAFFDQMWNYSLVNMLTVIGDAPFPPDDYGALAARLNADNALHADSMKSFVQVYRTEFQGGLSLAMTTAQQVMQELASKALGKPVIPTAKERADAEQHLYNFFCAAIAKKDVALALRTLHIGALCHAAVRWDQRRRLTGNDLHDFHHAEAAVGYCDIFLTEKPLRTLLEQKHLQVGQDFPCRIISSASEAAEWAEHF